jgi:hypothetical protein
MKPTFTTNLERKKSLLNHLKALDTVDYGSWTIRYVDPLTGEQWVDEAITGTHGPGIRCLTKLPQPSCEELLAICINSQYLDEAIVSAFKLADHPEFYPEMLTRLEQLIETCDLGAAERVVLIICWSNMERTFNYRPIIGKTSDEIEKDWNEIVEIAAKATRLKQKASGIAGKEFTKDWNDLEGKL